MKPLTKRQHEVFQYIKNYMQSHSYAPSYREIMQYFSFSSLGTVYKYIQILKDKEMLNQHGRSFSLPQEQKQKMGISLPFIGYISAGKPIILFPKSRSFEVSPSLVESPEATYVLQVQGDSLTDELMADGDYLLVEARQKARSGETVVALLNQGDIVIKKYYQDEVYIRLVSFNTQNYPLVIQEDDLAIQGVVIALIRNQISASSSSGSGS